MPWDGSEVDVWIVTVCERGEANPVLRKVDMDEVER